MTGRSVLELGCRDGAVCREAVGHGASRVLGLATNRDHVERSRQAAIECGSMADFQLIDFHGPLPRESFDDVLCLDALRLFPEPFAILDQLVDVTGDQLVIEVDEIGSKGQKSLKLNWWRRLLLRGLRDLPVVFVAPNSLRTNRRRFYVSPEAVRRFLADQRQVFCKVEVISSPRRGRRLIVAKRRHIDRLVVIAGPTSAGKTTLINHLAGGDVPTELQSLGLSRATQWDTLDVYGIVRDKRPRLANVLMHYDFLTRVRWGLEQSQMSDFDDIVHCANHVTFLTLWTEPQQLLKQFHQSEIVDHLQRTGKAPSNSKTLQLQQDYSDPVKIVQYYKAWFDHAVTLGGQHHVVSQSPQWRVTSVDQWRQEHE